MKFVPVLRASRTRYLLSAAVFGLSVALSGCGSGNASSHDVVSDTTTSTTVSVSGQAALVAYRNFQNAYLAAGNPMNPDDPRLAQYATGKELTDVRKSFLGLKIDGDILEGTIKVSPVLVSVTDTTATIRDCSTDAGRVVKAATGVEVGKSTVTNELLLVTMSFEGGNWRVAAIDHEGSGCSVDSSS